MPVLKSFKKINTLLLLRLIIQLPAVFVPCCSLGLIHPVQWVANACINNNGNSFSQFTPIHTTSMSLSSHHVVDATSDWVHHSSPFLCTTTSSATAATTALIILNAPIRKPPSPVFCRLWEKSTFRVCADGGANRLYQATVSSSSSSSSYDEKKNTNQNNKYNFLPSLITGDLDSLKDHVRSYYEQHGVPIVRVHDQDRNDLDKSLEAVLEASSSSSSIIIPAPSCVTTGGDDHYDDDDDDNVDMNKDTRKKYYDTCFIYGAFGGRLDQEMSSLQSLYKYAKRNDDSGKKNDAQQQQQHLQNLWLYNDRNVAILLQPNQKHVLQFPNYDDDDDNADSSNDNDDNNNNNDKDEQLRGNNFILGEGPTCGLIPLGFACDKVTTTGLKWDLNNDTLAFGGLVSTSNRMVAEKITIEICSSQPLLFTAEIIKNTKKNDDAKSNDKESSNDDVEEEGW